MGAPEKTIIQKLTEIHNTIALELAAADAAAATAKATAIAAGLAVPAAPPPSSDLAEHLSTFAIRAIRNGPGSKEWEDYMKEIVGLNAPKQLARLTFKDDQFDQEYVIKSNVYIVANAVCGSHTSTNTLANVEVTGPDIIDKLLPPEL